MDASPVNVTIVVTVEIMADNRVLFRRQRVYKGYC
jgi:hypothetical protein